ncbi:hypothetical protein G7062_09455 [Erysipelothrix sp. HDW6C]|uniref:hypothetical protein n=1 Tax=Erysipelothrix sp. HDW6C TaxID=2714930 RepID=UPI00140B0365|nr:hypothetical protein [Erysipelothrix sp. HDW6C]QIK70515.1 hypothetical protein G7062_09455 [Erysipelothrix sp. HDW6C]
MENEVSQVIIVNRSAADASIQIVIPPFRPISLFELEDSFEEVTREIKDNIHDVRLSDKIIGFVTAFKDSMDEEDVLPIVEYFLQGDVTTMDPNQIQLVFATIKEFIDFTNDNERLMH